MIFSTELLIQQMPVIRVQYGSFDVEIVQRARRIIEASQVSEMVQFISFSTGLFKSKVPELQNCPQLMIFFFYLLNLYLTITIDLN